MRSIVFAMVCALSAGAWSPASADEPCPPGADSYPQSEFGEALTTHELGCVRQLSPREIVFTAGLAHALLEQCGLPRDVGSRGTLATFLTSSQWVAMVGREYGNPNLGQGLADQAGSSVTYSAGIAALDMIGGCSSPAAEPLADGIVRYLRRSASESPYVDGCQRYYSGRYSRRQCQCLADIARAVYPNIHQSTFSRESIATLIQRNPFVGLQVALQCGFGNY
ncbi:MAG: hypothetical protein H6842_07975 [Rhodospirillaceae bacterium]|nr:hypothetical protein [Rhodospirillaceae bacterium]